MLINNGEKDFKEKIFKETDLKKRIFEEKDLEKKIFGEKDLENKAFGETDLKKKIFEGKDLEKKNFGEKDLENRAFGETDLKKRIFGEKDLEDTVLKEADLKKRIFEETELFLFDLDGTIYVGDKLIDGALDVIKRLERAGKKICFLTNNSSKAKAEYMKKLRKLGLPATDGELFTSSQSTYEYLLREHGGKRVWLAATDEVKNDFFAAGVNVVENDPEVAVLTFDTSMTYQKIDTLCRYLYQGVFFAATHSDLNCPHPVSPMPDVGSFIALAKAATGRDPDAVCGKPFKPCADGISARYRTENKRIAMVGDRLYTDIRFGNNFGYSSILVMTGTTTADMLEISPDKPTATFGSVADFLEFI
jgi:HAD superfamily hydrolase (TIGR01450 family)